MMLGSMHLTPSALGSICMRLYCEGAHTCLTNGTIGAQNRTSSTHAGRPFSGSPWHRAFSGHSLIPLGTICQGLANQRGLPMVFTTGSEPSGTGHQTTTLSALLWKIKQPQSCAVSGCLLHQRLATHLTFDNHQRPAGKLLICGLPRSVVACWAAHTSSATTLLLLLLHSAAA